MSCLPAKTRKGGLQAETPHHLASPFTERPASDLEVPLPHLPASAPLFPGPSICSLFPSGLTHFQKLTLHQPRTFLLSLQAQLGNPEHLTRPQILPLQNRGGRDVLRSKQENEIRNVLGLRA